MIATKSSHRLPGLCGTWRRGHLWCAKHTELGGCHDQHPLGAGTAWAWHTRGWGERKLLPVWSVVSSEPRTPQEPCLARPSPAPPCPTLSVPEAPAPDPHCSQTSLLGLPSQLGALEPAHSKDCPAPTPSASFKEAPGAGVHLYAGAKPHAPPGSTSLAVSAVLLVVLRRGSCSGERSSWGFAPLLPLSLVHLKNCTHHSKSSLAPPPLRSLPGSLPSLAELSPLLWAPAVGLSHAQVAVSEGVTCLSSHQTEPSEGSSQSRNSKGEMNCKADRLY